MKMRNKRHLIQKLSLILCNNKNINQRKDQIDITILFLQSLGQYTQSFKSLSYRGCSNTFKTHFKIFVLFHRYNSLSPRKHLTDKNSKVQSFSQRLKTFYLPITAPFESQLIFRLELVEDGKIKLIKQTGSQDDFNINLRLNKFEEDDKKNEDQFPENLANLPTLQQEDDEEDDQSDDENIVNIKQLTTSNPKQAYKNILKYNPRTLQSLVDKSQLGQSKIKDIKIACPKYLYHNHVEHFQTSITNNVSPVNNTISRCSPISSIKLLEEKEKPKIKLLPLEIKPFSQITLTNISPTTLSRNKPSPKNQLKKYFQCSQKNIKNITFGQLLIKV